MKIILLFILMALVSCQPEKKNQDVLTENSDTEVNGGEGQLEQEDLSSCRPQDLGLGDSITSPKSITEAIDLINALPRPVTIRCFLEALKRPLTIYLTSSSLSVQPAVGPGSPRVFLMSFPLIMSIATSGEASYLLEFAEIVDATNSYKGEIKFPVSKGLLPPSAAFDRIDLGDGSSCRGCHRNETLEEYSSGNYGYISMALKPERADDISIETFKEQLVACDTISDYTRRCKILRALYDRDIPKQGQFPESIPTLFESLNL